MTVPLTYHTFVSGLQGFIKFFLKAYVVQGYHAISSDLSIPLGIIATIYISVLGISTAMGWSKLSIGTVFGAVLKIGLIYAAVLNWAFVSEYGYEFVNHATEEVGNSLLQNMPSKYQYLDVMKGLQATLNQFTTIGSEVFNSGHWDSVGPYIAGIMIWAFGYAMVGLGLFEIVLSQITLAILFVIVPLIALFMFFKSLQGIFDRWLGLVIGAALLQLFVKAILALSIQLAYWWESTIDLTNLGEVGALPVVLIGIICIGLICKASTLAYTIGGGYFTFSGASMFGRTVGGLFSGVANTFGTAASSIASALKFGESTVGAVYDQARARVHKLRRSIQRGDA